MKQTLAPVAMIRTSPEVIRALERIRERWMAHYHGVDPGMEAVWRGVSRHAIIATAVQGYAASQVTKIAQDRQVRLASRGKGV
jgi:hypothetical protein